MPDRQCAACLAIFLQEDKDNQYWLRRENPAAGLLLLNQTEPNEENKKFIQDVIRKYLNVKTFKECIGESGVDNNFFLQKVNKKLISLF